MKIEALENEENLTERSSEQTIFIKLENSFENFENEETFSIPTLLTPCQFSTEEYIRKTNYMLHR